MRRKKNLLVGLSFLALIVACGVGQTLIDDTAEEQQVANGDNLVPMFEVDPFWPKPLPDHWVLGSTIGVDEDSRDHVWIIHRKGSLSATEIPASLDPPLADTCCAPAPPVLEFDSEGNVVGNWGGPGDEYTWPASITESQSTIWIMYGLAGMVRVTRMC